MNVYEFSNESLNLKLYEFDPQSRTVKYSSNNIVERHYMKFPYIQFLFIYVGDNISRFKITTSLNKMNSEYNTFYEIFNVGCLGTWQSTNNPLDWIDRFWNTTFFGKDINIKYMYHVQNNNKISDFRSNTNAFNLTDRYLYLNFIHKNNLIDLFKTAPFSINYHKPYISKEILDEIEVIIENIPQIDLQLSMIRHKPSAISEIINPSRELIMEAIHIDCFSIFDIVCNTNLNTDFIDAAKICIPKIEEYVIAKRVPRTYLIKLDKIKKLMEIL